MAPGLGLWSLAMARREDDQDAVLCAWGECPCDPTAWPCESARDLKAVGAALDACRRLGINVGKPDPRPESAARWTCKACGTRATGRAAPGPCFGPLCPDRRAGWAPLDDGPTCPWCSGPVLP